MLAVGVGGTGVVRIFFLLPIIAPFYLSLSESRLDID